MPDPDPRDTPGPAEPPAPTSAVDRLAPEPASVADLLAEARAAQRAAGIRRPTAAELPALLTDGAHLIDIRTPWTRDTEGHVPGGIVVEHTVLLWRLDPASPNRMAGGPGPDDLVIVMCNEGYQSTLTAEMLRHLGFSRATDLADGFRGYAAAGLPIAAHPTRYVT